MGNFGKWLEEKNPAHLQELNAGLGRAMGRSDKIMGGVGDSAYNTTAGITDVLTGAIKQIQAHNPKADRGKIIRAMKMALDKLDAPEVAEIAPAQ